MRKEYLKILDDVDLKELEKFGFKKNRNVYIAEQIKGFRRETLAFHPKDKELYGDALEILFDITKANLVEKVVEK